MHVMSVPSSFPFVLIVMINGAELQSSTENLAKFTGQLAKFHRKVVQIPRLTMACNSWVKLSLLFSYWWLLGLCATSTVPTGWTTNRREDYTYKYWNRRPLDLTLYHHKLIHVMITCYINSSYWLNDQQSHGLYLQILESSAFRLDVLSSQVNSCNDHMLHQQFLLTERPTDMRIILTNTGIVSL